MDNTIYSDWVFFLWWVRRLLPHLLACVSTTSLNCLRLWLALVGLLASVVVARCLVGLLARWFYLLAYGGLLVHLSSLSACLLA